MRGAVSVPNHSRRERGFTLTELAIVLLIVAVLLGGLLMPLSARIDMRNVAQTEQTLADIRDALIGFAAANGRLPCPAPATTASGAAEAGMEATTGSGSALACAEEAGVLPWATLGVVETDAWNRRFSYRVTDDFARGATGQTSFSGSSCPPPSPPTNAAFALCSEGDITVNSGGGGSAIAIKVPVVVISHGKNGNGAFTSQGTQLSVGTDTDELDNHLTSAGTDTANRIFVSAPPSNSFDDIVTWLSPSILYSRLIVAGRLP
jgi:prepilin-type N-terminal cleavage/methylation domain-containing protein